MPLQLTIITTIAAVLVGLLLGGLVNYLADVLPALRSTADDDNDTPDGAETQPMAPPERAPGPSIYSLFASTHPETAAAWRYPAVEVGTALAAGLVWVIGPNAPALRAIYIIYLTLFILITVIDVEHKLVLDVIIIPALAFALLEIILSGRISFTNALTGYAFAQLVVLAFYVMGHVYVWINNARREEQINTVALGFGDVTLASLCGMLVGFLGSITMLLLMTLIGALSAVLFLILNRLLQGGGGLRTAIPYGPSIVLAAAIVLLFGNDFLWFIIGS